MNTRSIGNDPQSACPAPAPYMRGQFRSAAIRIFLAVPSLRHLPVTGATIPDWFPRSQRDQICRRIDLNTFVELGIRIGRQAPPLRQRAFSHSAPCRSKAASLHIARIVVSSGAIIPARAPASMLMLQSVMRPSIESERTAGPAYSITCPSSAVGSNLPDNPQRQILRAHSVGSVRFTSNLHGLRLLLRQALRRQNMLDFRSANPKRQRAKSAVRAGMAVAADNRHAGLRQSQFRTDHVHDALFGRIDIKQPNAEFLAVRPAARQSASPQSDR